MTAWEAGTTHHTAPTLSLLQEPQGHRDSGRGLGRGQEMWPRAPQSSLASLRPLFPPPSPPGYEPCDLGWHQPSVPVSPLHGECGRGPLTGWQGD